MISWIITRARSHAGTNILGHRLRVGSLTIMLIGWSIDPHHRLASVSRLDRKCSHIHVRLPPSIDFPSDNFLRKSNSIWNITYLIAGLGFHSKIALTFLDCMSEVYGISVMLINVRVGLGWTRNGERTPVSVSVGTDRRGMRRGYHMSVLYTLWRKARLSF